MHLSQILPLALAAASPAFAVTAITNDQMISALQTGGLDLAMAYAPMWFFGQSQNQPPCYPTWAFGGTPETNDTYLLEHKTPPAAQCDYPDVGCNCRNPGIDIRNPGPAFPIYYTFAQCNDNEVRVAYNLFYEKDGAKFLFVDTGHDYDWERVIIVHNKDPDGTWQPSKAMLSAHSGYNTKNWADIQNTLSNEDVNAGKAKDSNGLQNLDHPKVYVAWSKHAQFDSRNTGWNDPASQSLGRAFRSDDWWHFVERNYYVLADGTTEAGKAIGTAGWGDADSNPVKVHEGLCTAA